MKWHIVLGAFLIGALTVSNVSVLAGGRKSQDKSVWSTAVVDSGMIRSTLDAASPMSLGKDRDTKTQNETERQIKALCDQGYEPYAASAYASRFYTGERMWFFRTKS